MWIKATDRLPALMKDVSFKYNYPNGDVKRFGGCVYTGSNGEYFLLNGSGTTFSKSLFDKIEWLDEETPDPELTTLKSSIEEKDRRIAELVEGLEGLILGHHFTIHFDGKEEQSKYNDALRTAKLLINKNKQA